MTDDAAVQVHVDRLTQMNNPTSRVPDKIRSEDIAMHVGNAAEVIAENVLVVHNIVQPSDSACPFLQMCKDGVDLIPDHLCRSRTKSGALQTAFIPNSS